MLVDFHTHTNYSDGLLSPKELVEHAKEVGVEAMALTDHDTVDGVMEAEQEALKSGIRFIRGIEISTFDDEHPSMHILGLGLQDLSVFSQIQKQNRDSRKKRNLIILQKLKEMYDISVDYADLEKEFKGTIGKGNISQYLTHKGYYPTYKDANKVVMQFKGLSCGIEVKKVRFCGENSVSIGILFSLSFGFFSCSAIASIILDDDIRYSKTNTQFFIFINIQIMYICNIFNLVTHDKFASEAERCNRLFKRLIDSSLDPSVRLFYLFLGGNGRTVFQRGFHAEFIIRTQGYIVIHTIMQRHFTPKRIQIFIFRVCTQK